VNCRPHCISSDRVIRCATGVPSLGAAIDDIRAVADVRTDAVSWVDGCLWPNTEFRGKRRLLRPRCEVNFRHPLLPFTAVFVGWLVSEWSSRSAWVLRGGSSAETTFLQARVALGVISATSSQCLVATRCCRSSRGGILMVDQATGAIMYCYVRGEIPCATRQQPK
jgi:hypothetical protein